MRFCDCKFCNKFENNVINKMKLCICRATAKVFLYVQGVSPDVFLTTFCCERLPFIITNGNYLRSLRSIRMFIHEFYCECDLGPYIGIKHWERSTTLTLTCIPTVGTFHQSDLSADVESPHPSLNKFCWLQGGLHTKYGRKNAFVAFLYA